MSYIDAMIAQGGTPFDVAKYTSAGHAGQLAKQNDLINLGKQKELDEFDANAQGRMDKREALSIVAGVKAAAPYFQAGDYNATVASLEARKAALLANDPNTDVSHTQWAIDKLKSGTPEDVAQVGQAFNEILAVEEKAKADYTLGDTRYSGATNQPLATNATPPADGAKPRYETINNVPRWIEGPDKGKPVFPGVEISPETERNLTNEAGVRKEFNGLLGDYYKVSDAFAKIKASASNPSPAGDLSLVFQFMKMLDPGSTVRQSEFDTAEGARAELQRAQESGGIVPNFVWGAINKLSTGQILLENQRNDFVSRANKLYGASHSQAQKTASAYTIIAKDAGMPVESIIANFIAQGNQEDIPLPEGYTEIP